MMLDWLRYWPYQPRFLGLLRDLPRAEAAEEFRCWMEARPERWEQLRQLVADDGVALGTTDADIRALDDWFRSSVEANPQDNSRLANRWYAVVNDLTVVLGDVMIQRCPNLRWEFQTKGGKRDIAYQHHVVTGFTKVANPNYYVDLSRVIATYGYRIIADLPVYDDFFVTLLQDAQTKA